MRIFGEHISNSVADTNALGARLAEILNAGSVAAFEGDLGSGKTTMIKAIVGILGADISEVASPSFAIVHDYGGSTPLHHIDLYRVEPDELEQLGLREILDGDDICLVEWADKFPSLIPPGTLWVHIERIDENSRKISISRQDKL